MNRMVSPPIINVDDNDSVRYARSRTLRQAGFQVLEASAGEDALRLARDSRPEVMVLDVNLPDMTGIEVCRRLKSDPATSGILVLHISATAVELKDLVRGLENGADNYLVEPIPPAALVASVNALLRIRRAERGLRETEERFRLAAEAVNALIYEYDPLERSVQRTRGLFELVGLHPHEAEPTVEWWKQRVHPQDLPAAWERVSRALEGGEGGFSVEYRVLHKDGRYVWVWDKGLVVRGTNGRVTRLVGSIIDVTERKQAEEARQQLLERERAAREEAERANRLKDEFLATLSHELRTPLQAILGWLWAVRTGELDEEGVRQALETVERNAKLQAQLIDDLLDVSRIISGKLRLDFRPVHLPPIIQAALEVVRPAADSKEIRLHLELDPQVSPVSGDASRLQQVAWNLLSNAVKFTPRGGRVEVRLERSDSEVRLRVTDTGKGINQEFLPYIFDRFRQADSSTTRAYAGLGLGLAIVRHLVELHGGSVQAESAGEGQGATFTVSLPLPAAYRDLARPEGQTRPPAIRSGSRPLRGLHVLVVEDEPDAREWLKTVLALEGAEVTTCLSVTQALEEVRRSRPHVLVSDIGLPGEDGYSLPGRMRASLPELRGVPALALTAYARGEDRDRALASGYQAYLAKPVDSEELVSAVATLARAGFLAG